MHLVSKSFGVAGKKLVIGEIVDGTKYKLINKLLRAGFLTELDKSIKPVKCQLCDRMFNCEKTLDSHYLTEHPNDVVQTDDEK